jgi:threonine dehydrogenase-like Zn-dependent dehydrogenase
VGVAEAEAPLGQRVMNHHYKGCGVCGHCRTGWSQLCGAGIVVYGVTGHGAHAHYMKAPARTMLPLPDALSFEEGAAISCGTGTAYAALRRMKLSGEHTLAVFGQGPVGLSATLLGTAMGARVIALDVNPQRRALAQMLGAETVLDPGSADPVESLRALTKGEGVDLALDCSAAPEARAAAVRSVRTWGTACFVGEGGEVRLNVSQDLLRRQVTLIGSWTFSSVGQMDCARFVAERGIALKKLITERWRIDQAAEAYRLFDRQSTGKGVFVF